ncbi:hypothetical protein FF38_07544 [Lucilia cuprina]|uniref:Uncharacterized protein n=1 Tax=Lucilia cuprina TaxID=7375 RepID=A0A0L0C2C4_LUCCU|nr:hypothetical protein FF38_07544 [Lucilia cuprina]
MTWARPGFEPGTSRTLSGNHTPRPTSQLVKTESLLSHFLIVKTSFPLILIVLEDSQLVKFQKLLIVDNVLCWALLTIPKVFSLMAASSCCDIISIKCFLMECVSKTTN